MEDINSILQDEKSSEKLYALPYPVENFEKLEERLKTLQRKLKGITEKRSSDT